MATQGIVAAGEGRMQTSPESQEGTWWHEQLRLNSSTLTGHLGPTWTLFYSHLAVFPLLQVAHGSGQVSVPALSTCFY